MDGLPVLALSLHKLHPFLQPKHQNIVIQKDSFSCHFEGTVFHTLRKNLFFIKFAHFFLFSGGSKYSF